MNRLAITAVAAIGAGAWALILAHNGWVIPTSFFSPLSAVVTILVVVLLVFEKWAWSWPLVSSLVGRPDVRGTWKGVVKSSAKTPSYSSEPAPVEVYMVVRQTFSELHLRLFSAESQSLSLAAALAMEAPEQFSVTWVYRNEPRHLLKDKSPVHHGGGLLRLGGSKLSTMMGHYWTDRSTSGELELTLVSRKRGNDFEGAKRLAG